MGKSLTEERVNVSSTQIRFNRLASIKLHLSKGVRFTLSHNIDTDQKYFALLPELSIRKGHALSKHSKDGSFSMTTDRMNIKVKLDKGVYSFSEPEFDGELDWYELINDEKDDV